MCGVRLDARPSKRSPIVWIEVALVVGVLAAVWLWWTRNDTHLEDISIPALAPPTVVVIVTSTAAATPTAAPTSTPTTVLPSTPLATPTPIIHVVQAGENLEYIAGNYGVQMADLVAANQLSDPDRLQVGQRLLIPASTPGPPSVMASPTPAGGTLNYIVQKEDTLTTIAVRFNAPISAIRAINKLGKDAQIRPGQVLLIPLPTPTAIPTPEPSPTPTPGSSYRWSAPFLLSPANGAVIAGAAEPMLRWAAVGLLAEDEWYVVRLWAEDAALPRPPPYWTKGTSWRVGIEWGPPQGRRYLWQVIVVRAEELVPDRVPVPDRVKGGSRRAIEATSPASLVRSFIWGQAMNELDGR
jgi:LysM repeat protein